MAKRFAWLSAASRVKHRRALLYMTHRLAWPYSLGDGAMSILGEHGLADGRMDDGGWFISPPWQSGGQCDKSFAVKAQALSLAVRAPAGWPRPHSLCHAGPASGAGPRQPGRCVGAFWSGWFWGACSVLRSRRDPLPSSDPAICRASFSSRPIPGRCPLWGRLRGICRWPVVGVVRALSPWGTPLEPTTILDSPDCSLFSMSWHDHPGCGCMSRRLGAVRAAGYPGSGHLRWWARSCPNRSHSSASAQMAQRPPDTSTLRLCTQPQRCHLYNLNVAPTNPSPPCTPDT